MSIFNQILTFFSSNFCIFLTANQTQNKEKKIYRQSPKHGTDGQTNRQQRNKVNQSELSYDNDNKISFKTQDGEKDMQEIGGISRIKGQREQKPVNTKKSERDERGDKDRDTMKERKSKISHSSSGESAGTGRGREVGIDSILLVGNDIGVGRSVEEQKEFDDSNEARLLKIARGRYKCSRCGALKVRK